MSTHNDEALDALTDAEVVKMSETIREMWRKKIAAGEMQLDPKRMRAYDASLKELKQLTGR